MRSGQPTSAPPRLGVVIVTYRSETALRRTLPALVRELEPGDELVVVDNASGDGTLDAVAELAPGAVVVRNAANVGFAAAANQGAEQCGAELLLLLNPDAVPEPGFGRAIRRPLADGRGWAAWQGLVTAEAGRVVNTSGGVVHFTGVSWAGQAGAALTEAAPGPLEVAFASGACLAVRREAWRSVGGFRAGFFMYCEDVDLSLRLRLAGERVGVEPSARVDHDYEFVKGPAKWRRLEANRWRVVLGVYPGALLALVAPALLATELALVPVALAGRWGRQKALAISDVLAELPTLLAERRGIQRTQAVSAVEFAESLAPALSSTYLGRAGRSPLLASALRLYWRLVVAVLDLRP